MKNGFYKVDNFLGEGELELLDEVLCRFHKTWLEENRENYEKNGLINSAYITNKETTSQKDRLNLFKLIGSKKIKNELSKVFKEEKACFLNTQLFFDPYNINKKNYWHRDIQYTGMPEEEQKRKIVEGGSNVIHFRIPLRDEVGVELIPTTNTRWDSELEYQVRHDLNGHSSNEELPFSQTIELKRGDLLVFCANMIHRGLYGGNRFAFDMLFFEWEKSIAKFVDPSSCPNEVELKQIENRAVFSHLN